jgi:hypothetical protein
MYRKLIHIIYESIISYTLKKAMKIEVKVLKKLPGKGMPEVKLIGMNIKRYCKI